MTALAPMWLAAAAAVALPLLIHLLARKEARRVRVGSIARLRAVAPVHARRVALTDLPLLALRAMVLVLLAVVLSRPVWRRAVAGEGPAVALVALQEPGAAAVADSLREEGFTIRPLTGSDDWAQLAALDRILPPRSRIVVVAPARVARARGTRPALASAVTWRHVGADTARRWVVNRRRIPSGAVRIVAARSDADRTTFRESAADPEAADAPRPDPFQVVIVHDVARTDEVAYVRAAVRAAAAFAGFQPSIVIRTVDDPTPAERATVAFWLTGRAPDAGVDVSLAPGGVLFIDAPGDGYARADAALTGVGIPDRYPPAIFRRALGAFPGAPVWRTADGQVALTAQTGDDHLWLRFVSRLHPEWSDLVQHPAFPELMVGLITAPRTWLTGAATFAVDSADARRVDGRQLVPRAASGAGTETDTPLSLPLWLLLLAVAAVERAMTGRRRQ